MLAGPGTGKSATVIRMMLEMADNGAGRGKLLTFTRAATNELKGKVAEHPEALESPSTVHSFAISTILANPETSGLPESLRIADGWEWKELIRFHLKDLVGSTARGGDTELSDCDFLADFAPGTTYFDLSDLVAELQ